MSMQDLRVIVAERSTMGIYIRGETIELPHHFICFLLEGYVKIEGTNELIASPSALFPSSVDLNFRGSGTSGVKSTSFYHQSSCYEVETRVRAVMFDIAAFEPKRILPRRSSSLIPHSVDHPTGSLSRDHSSLMSFPECLHTSVPDHEHSRDTTDQHENNLSTKAMQLSIYGRTMKNGQWGGKSFSSSQVKPSISRSFPRIPSNRGGKTLVSVRSEGSTTAREILKGKSVTSPLSSNIRRNRVMDNDSSDESGAEDEHIVRIDSPSRLSFHQAS